MNTNPSDALARFGWTNKCVVPALGDCWEWNGSRCTQRGGYGQVRFDGRTWKAHRLAFTAWRESIPEGLFVLHRCDNPPCINPAHLFVGTAADNNWDKARKGRGVNPVYASAEAPAAKLTPAQVEEIRGLIGRLTLQQIGDRYGVTKQAIYRIKKGKSWTLDKMTR